MRDLPWGEYRTTVVIEVYRVCCPQCGVKVEKVPQLPSKAPFSKRFEDAVGLACESAAVRQVARQFRLAASTVRAIDLRYLQRWSAARRKDPLVQMGVDEIYFGKQMKFITVVSNLDTGEPLWFGQDRKQETLDEFFRTELSALQRKRIEAACVDICAFCRSITAMDFSLSIKLASMRSSRLSNCKIPLLVFVDQAINGESKDERHYAPADLAKAWGVSTETVRQIFRNEPGVLRLGTNGDQRVRGYVTLRIPQSVAARVHARLTAIPQTR